MYVYVLHIYLIYTHVITHLFAYPPPFLSLSLSLSLSIYPSNLSIYPICLPSLSIHLPIYLSSIYAGYARKAVYLIQQIDITGNRVHRFCLQELKGRTSPNSSRPSPKALMLT